jgi:hypothetical protein
VLQSREPKTENQVYVIYAQLCSEASVVPKSEACRVNTDRMSLQIECQPPTPTTTIHTHKSAHITHSQRKNRASKPNTSSNILQITQASTIPLFNS